MDYQNFVELEDQFNHLPRENEKLQVALRGAVLQQRRTGG